mmetsp:Transcript_5931/g.15074  ORF Transcript_5931/g.15074 Transcript_5931/m.15074 type:complete len:224 (-) Transcript_5931:749-1420(-)
MRDELVDAEVVHHGAADHEQVPYGVVWYPEGTLVAHIEGHAGGVQDPSHDEKEQAPWLRGHPLVDLGRAQHARPPHAEVRDDVHSNLERAVVQCGEQDAAHCHRPHEGEQADGVDRLVGEENGEEGRVGARDEQVDGDLVEDGEDLGNLLVKREGRVEESGGEVEHEEGDQVDDARDSVRPASDDDAIVPLAVTVLEPVRVGLGDLRREEDGADDHEDHAHCV